MADKPTDEELATAALAKAQEDAADAPAKAKMHKWLDEWADKRLTAAPPHKTNTPRPPTFLESLFGNG